MHTEPFPTLQNATAQQQEAYQQAFALLPPVLQQKLAKAHLRFSIHAGEPSGGRLGAIGPDNHIALQAEAFPERSGNVLPLAGTMLGFGYASFYADMVRPDEPVFLAAEEAYMERLSPNAPAGQSPQERLQAFREMPFAERVAEIMGSAFVDASDPNPSPLASATLEPREQFYGSFVARALKREHPELAQALKEELEIVRPMEKTPDVSEPTGEILDGPVRIMVNPKQLGKVSEEAIAKFRAMSAAWPEKFRALMNDRGVTFVLNSIAKPDSVGIYENKYDKCVFLSEQYLLSELATVMKDTGRSDRMTLQSLTTMYSGVQAAVGNRPETLDWEEAKQEYAEFVQGDGQLKSTIARAAPSVKILMAISDPKAPAPRSIKDFESRLPALAEARREYLAYIDAQYAELQREKTPKLLAQYPVTDTVFGINHGALTAPQAQYMQTVNQLVAKLGVPPMELDKEVNIQTALVGMNLINNFRATTAFKYYEQTNQPGRFAREEELADLAFAEDFGMDLVTGKVEVLKIEKANNAFFKDRDPLKKTIEKREADLEPGFRVPYILAGHHFQSVLDLGLTSGPKDSLSSEIANSVPEHKAMINNVSDHELVWQRKRQSLRKIFDREHSIPTSMLPRIGAGAITFETLAEKPEDMKSFGLTYHAPSLLHTVNYAVRQAAVAVANGKDPSGALAAHIQPELDRLRALEDAILKTPAQLAQEEAAAKAQAEAAQRAQEHKKTREEKQAEEKERQRQAQEARAAADAATPKHPACSDELRPYIGELCGSMDLRDAALAASAEKLLPPELQQVMELHLGASNIGIEKQRDRLMEAHKAVLATALAEATRLLTEEPPAHPALQAALLQSPVYLALLTGKPKALQAAQREHDEIAAAEEFTPAERAQLRADHVCTLLSLPAVTLPEPAAPEPATLPGETPPAAAAPEATQEAVRLPEVYEDYEALRARRQAEPDYQKALEGATWALDYAMNDARSDQCAEADCRLQSTSGGFIITTQFGKDGKVLPNRKAVIQLKKFGITTIDDALDIFFSLESKLYAEGTGFKTLFPVALGNEAHSNRRPSAVANQTIGANDAVPQQLVDLKAEDIHFTGEAVRALEPPEGLKKATITGQVIDLNGMAALQVRSWKTPKAKGTKFQCETLLLPLGVRYEEAEDTVAHRSAVRRIDLALKAAKLYIREYHVTKKELITEIKELAEKDAETAKRDPLFAAQFTGEWFEPKTLFVEGFERAQEIIGFPASGHGQKTRLSAGYLEQETESGNNSWVLHFSVEAKDDAPLVVQGKVQPNEQWHHMRSRAIRLSTSDLDLAQFQAQWAMGTVIRMFQQDLVEGVRERGRPALPPDHHWKLERRHNTLNDTDAVVLEGAPLKDQERKIRNRFEQKRVDISDPALNWSKTYALIGYFVRSFNDDVAVELHNVQHHNGTTQFTLQLKRGFRENNEVADPFLDSGGSLGGRPAYRVPDYGIVSQGEPVFHLDKEGEAKPLQVTFELRAPEYTSAEREEQIHTLAAHFNTTVRKAAWTHYRPYAAADSQQQIRLVPRYDQAIVADNF